MKLYDSSIAPNPFTVRFFIAERGFLSIDVGAVDLLNLANRHEPYLSINPRGELPALLLDDGTALTEITAICEYLDEIAINGQSLIGDTAEQRAATRMWTRRVDLEIAQRFIDWWRGSEDAETYYRGNRVTQSGGREANRLMANQGFNRLDQDLAGRSFLFGDRPGMADILLFAFMFTMIGAIPWLNPPGRTNVADWFKRMSERPSVAAACEPVRAIRADAGGPEA
ncbi:glutathione S-transferase N-terminal domain-containing protein [Kaistia dalseonensis]|uniref:Glutathione S-transferase n=1 Tax=Kaistia dalseonensis TaxID=410840 RepID=A0ABU0HBC8_9HYPH|nr:glutathione S-transferase N-terminal domain-containing protein [Kaistia dalseonensis]MCX5496663.1 glutathione S-transferase N-terminal domain-containing protein [Kaistia dalseonensis]MDQ0439287.1 glutathione S-transferase [Kaistia dalseonensis]